MCKLRRRVSRLWIYDYKRLWILYEVFRPVRSTTSYRFFAPFVPPVQRNTEQPNTVQWSSSSTLLSNYLTIMFDVVKTTWKLINEMYFTNKHFCHEKYFTPIRDFVFGSISTFVRVYVNASGTFFFTCLVKYQDDR